MGWKKKTQREQIDDCIKGHEQEIKDLGIYNHYDDYGKLVRKNFIQYNGDTKLLIMQLLENVYACRKKTGLKCSFPLTSIMLCDKDEDRNLIQNYHTIQSRMQVLEKEGVIKRYQTNKYFVVIFLVDIRKPFERKNKKYYKQKELTTAPMINEIREIEKQKEEQEEKKEEDFKEKINQQLDTIDIGDNEKDKFKDMFWEFCDSRIGSKGQKIKKKTELAITRKTGPLDMLTNARQNGHDPYVALESCLNRGYENIGYYQYSDLKQLNKKQELIRYGVSNDDELISDFTHLTNEFKEGRIKTIDELVNKSKIGQATQIGSYIKTISKYQGEKLAKEQIKQQEVNTSKNDKEQMTRLINYCKTFSNDKVNYQYVMSNILDKNVGEKVYKLLVKHFVNKITNKYNNKYSQDVQKGTDFESTCLSMLTTARDNHIDYIPVIYAYYIFSNMPDDWQYRTNDVEIIDKISCKTTLENFIKENVVKQIKTEQFVNGYWCKVLQKIEYKGYYSDGITNEPTKQEKLFNILCEQLVNRYNGEIIDIVKFRSLTTINVDKEKQSVEFKSELDLNSEVCKIFLHTVNDILDKMYKKHININIV